MKHHGLSILVFSVFCLLISTTGDGALARNRQIQVLGSATMQVQPDLAKISLGVTSEGKDPLATVDATSSAARRILDFALKWGVRREEIATSSVNLSPKMKNVRNPDGSFSNEQIGYTASNVVSIDIRDISRLGEFTRKVLENGANRVQGVLFQLSDPVAIADEVRLQALKDARRKAEALANASGAKLGSILRIFQPPREEIRREEGVADMSTRRVTASIPIEAGLLSIRVEVDVVWALE